MLFALDDGVLIVRTTGVLLFHYCGGRTSERLCLQTLRCPGIELNCHLCIEVIIKFSPGYHVNPLGIGVNTVVTIMSYTTCCTVEVRCPLVNTEGY